MHALDYYQSQPGLERAKISLAARVTPSYAARMLCSRDRYDYAPLSLAIECWKHSGGGVDVLGSLKDSGTDWKALRQYLNKIDLK
jgi:hypothetical protein